ncbi:MAG: hypothetical protein KatS3mg009_1104 [Acidimicrobiia bacterium]|nr:MAG: hypothetical protein KatS3mg009_1104 [Acidimicrobiia bacterium]
MRTLIAEDEADPAVTVATRPRRHAGADVPFPPEAP